MCKSHIYRICIFRTRLVCKEDTSKARENEQSFKARNKLEFCPAIGSTPQIASPVTHDHTTFGNDKLTTQKKMFGDVWRCSENFSSDLAEVNCQLQLAWLCHVMVWN